MANRFPITYNVIFIFIRPDNGSEIETHFMARHAVRPPSNVSFFSV